MLSAQGANITKASEDCIEGGNDNVEEDDLNTLKEDMNTLEIALNLLEKNDKRKFKIKRVIRSTEREQSNHISARMRKTTNSDNF